MCESDDNIASFWGGYMFQQQQHPQKGSIDITCYSLYFDDRARIDPNSRVVVSSPTNFTPAKFSYFKSEFHVVLNRFRLSPHTSPARTKPWCASPTKVVHSITRAGEFGSTPLKHEAEQTGLQGLRPLTLTWVQQPTNRLLLR